MGDSSHVDDEREGRLFGARGLPEREQEFGHVASARDRQGQIALPRGKGKSGCDPDADAEATRATRHSLPISLAFILARSRPQTRIALFSSIFPNPPHHHLRRPWNTPLLPFRISLTPSGVVRGTCNLYLGIFLPLSLAIKSWIPLCPCP